MKKGNMRGRKEFTREIYRGNRLLFAGNLLALFLMAVLEVCVSYFMQQIIDTATGGTLAGLGRVSIGVLTAVALNSVFWYISFKLLNRYLERAMRQYKEHAFARIVRKNIRSFADESTGRYISALTNDAMTVQENYVRNVFTLFYQCALFVFGLSLMLYYSWILTLVAALLTLLPMLLAIALGGKLAARETELSRRNESFVGMVKDLLSGFSVIKSFKAEKEAGKLFNTENAEIERTRRRRNDTEKFISFLPNVAGSVAQFGIFIVGAFLAINGMETIGVTVAFVQMMNYLIQPVQVLPGIFASRRAAVALIDKLAEAVEENAEKSGAKRIGTIGEGIRIENLSFAYEGAAGPALKNVSLSFEAGKSYAIVGGSGSGKTTLLNLLLGSWDGYEGSISLGGVELRDVATESLYDLISVVQQNVFIFDNTVEENICMFRDFPQESVQQAIRQAGLDVLVSEKGADYRCGENGSALSGGEKQRISIARGLLRKAPVLMMDEATSALDAQTAWEVTDAVLNTDGLTRIVVTHRLDESLLKRYDGIIALRNGSVAEQGTYDELMEKKGYFYSLYNVSV